MDPKEVIILQSGDPWLTTDSLRIVGIFDSEDSFDEFATQMRDKGVISECGYKMLTGYYGIGRQCDINGGQLLVSKEPINPKLEDVDL